MPNLNNIKKFVVLIVLLVSGFFAYNYFFVDNKSKEMLSGAIIPAGTNAQQKVGNEILSLLLNLRALRLDPHIFSEKTFTGLKDFSVQLQDEPKGRTNPFNPIGVGDKTNPATTTQNQIIKNQ